jgi:hypothetical protein
MNREPDWEALSEVNFLINNRMAEQLNAALVSIEKLPDVEHHRGRALEMVRSALNMQTAWATLIRHKAGETRSLPASPQFDSQEMVNWLCGILHLSEMPDSDDAVTLLGNRETLQEAVMLLRSCAQTLGPGVRVLVDQQANGLWFRVRYGAVGVPPLSLEELFDSLQTNWRVQSASFELHRAQDFLKMNQCEMIYGVRNNDCELSFFVRALQRPTRRKEPSQQDKTRALLDAYNSDDTHHVITD